MTLRDLKKRYDWSGTVSDRGLMRGDFRQTELRSEPDAELLELLNVIAGNVGYVYEETRPRDSREAALGRASEVIRRAAKEGRLWELIFGAHRAEVLRIVLWAESRGEEIVVKKPLGVSRPPSGLSVYLNAEQANLLGGLGTRVGLEWNEATRTIALCKSPKSRVSIVKNSEGGGDLHYRLAFPDRHEVASRMAQFGLHRTERWELRPSEADPRLCEVVIQLPPESEMSEAVSRSRRKMPERGIPADGRRIDPIERLRAAIREFNEALADPDCASVEITVRTDGQLQPDVIKRPFVLRGKVIREEEL